MPVTDSSEPSDRSFAGRAGHPGDIGHTSRLVGKSSGCKEKIAESIEEDDHLGSDLLEVPQPNRLALRSTTDAACKMKSRSKLGTARHHEGCDGVVESVDRIDGVVALILALEAMAREQAPPDYQVLIVGPQ